MRNAGFTLVELMVAVAILAIVAAVAIPIYTQYSQRTYRAEAQADLMTCAQALERYAAQNFTYVGANIGDLCDPRSEAQGRYNITLVAATADEFELQATAIGAMAGTGDLTLDSAGNRTWDGNPSWEE
jgi:type IV pilus assembly protein PilE